MTGIKGPTPLSAPYPKAETGDDCWPSAVTPRRIIVACGGTGGHVFPGIAVATVLLRRGHAVELWMAGRDTERVSAFAWEGPIVNIPARGLPSGNLPRAAINAAGLLTAVMRCIVKMRRGTRPSAVLAMGSYASIGPGLAARALGIPLILHEANVVPGRAVTFLTRWADTVALAFPEAAEYLPDVRTTVTGFPLREPDSGGEDDFSGALPYPSSTRFTVMVTGGSLGAHHLNEVATKALCKLHASGVPFQVIHLAGRNDEAMVRQRYQQAGVPAAVFGFLRRMDCAYAAAHLAVCRAGAATCAELAAAGVAALLVPLPSAARDHQTANAVAVVSSGAADMIAQSNLQPDWLADYLAEHALSPTGLESMRDAALQRAVPDASETTATIVENAGAHGSRFTEKHETYNN